MHGKSHAQSVRDSLATVLARRVVQAPPPPWIARRRALCDACDVEPVKCEVAYKRTLQATRKRGCWFARFIARAESVCPHGRWET